MSSKTTETILAHMNKDHKTSLYDYLAVYCGIKLDLDDRRKSVELVDVRLDKLTLNYNDSGVLKSAVVPLSPPMKSLSDSRNRLISMAFEAADALGVSPYRIQHFVKPGLGLGALGVLFGVLETAMALSAFNSTVAARTIGVGSWVQSLFRVVLYGTAVLHVSEAIFTAKPLVEYYRMSARSRAAVYFFTVFVGFPTWVPLRKKADELKQHRREFERKL